MHAVQNKAQKHAFAASKHIRQRLPFDLLGIDSDNGSEAVNNKLWRYAVAKKLTSMRGRVARKNDNAYVE